MSKTAIAPDYSVDATSYAACGASPGTDAGAIGRLTPLRSPARMNLLTPPGQHPCHSNSPPFPSASPRPCAGARTLSVFDWIAMARSLDADGLEMYDWLPDLEPGYLDRVADAIRNSSFEMPMLCCSPDFTNPDPDARKRAIDREIEMVRVPPDRRSGDGVRSQRPALPGRRTGPRASNGRPSALTRCCPWPASTTSSSAWRTITRMASGNTPSSPRKKTSSSNCSSDPRPPACS